MVTAVGGRLECPINEELFIGMRAPDRPSLSPTLPKVEGGGIVGSSPFNRTLLQGKRI